MIVEVLLPVPLDKRFDYRLPETMTACFGQRVLVEFGQQKQQVGIVVAVRELTQKDDENTSLKSVLSVLDEFAIVDAAWWQLIQFAARYYAEPLGKAFKNALPKRLRSAEPMNIPQAFAYTLTELGKATLNENALPSNAKRQQQLLALCHDSALPLSESVLRQAGFGKPDWTKLVDKGWLSQQATSHYHDNSPIKQPNYALNTEQKQVIAAIKKTASHYQAHLIYGVTGSGKTEVYMNLIESAISLGQQVLLLVPEIALTPQMLSRFTERFGQRVAAYHSGLSDVARRDVFLAARNGDLPILIGTRSAIFVPMPELGLILIDEEHDLSYKQQEGFLYHARDLALYRARQANLNVVMGSATPSLESLSNVATGKIIQHELTERATDSILPEIIMVDRRGHGRQEVLAKSVQQAMRQVLQRGEQVLLFINRRGFAPVMMCGDCGWSSECPSCSVHQTAHMSQRQLCCHHCGHISALPIRCPDCHSADIYFAGVGTEKVEAQLHQQFPQQRILRLDRDKQRTAKQLDAALAQIHAGEVDIIVGTQLVVKGHHFPQVTMVCVVDADSALFSSNFRAEEQLYQQLIQVAGRAGRESHTGRVYIQSTVPSHAVFHAMLKQDYLGYAKTLLADRISHELPPQHALTLIKTSAKEKQTVLDYLRAIKDALREHNESIVVLGPVPLAIEKVNHRYQAQLWLSAKEKKTMQQALPLVSQIIRHFDSTNRYQTIIDVDAMLS